MDYSHLGIFRYFNVEGNQHDDKTVWWEKLLDRMNGRIEDLLEPGTDGLRDHAMANYIAGLTKAKTA